MKKIIESDDKNTGLESYLGETITLFCCRYIYNGKLTEVGPGHVRLADAGIVYETGPLTDSEWSDRQPLPHDWCVDRKSIESYGVLKK